MELTKDTLIEGQIVKKGTNLHIKENDLGSFLKDTLLDFEPSSEELRQDVLNAGKIYSNLSPVQQQSVEVSKYFKSPRTDKFLNHAWKNYASGDMSYNDVFRLAYKIIA